ILDALDIAHGEIKKLVAVQRELAEKAGKPKLQIDPPAVDEDLVRQIQAEFGAELDAATQVEDKLERQNATKTVEAKVIERFSGDPAAETFADYRAKAQKAFDHIEKKTIRERIAVHKKRPDGRSEREIRPI